MKDIKNKINNLKNNNDTLKSYVNAFKKISKTEELFKNNPDFDRLKEKKKNIDE